MTTNNKKTKYTPKNLIKSVLGQVPFTAELYWLVRHPEKSLNSRFSLKKLDDHVEELVSQVKEIRGTHKKAVVSLPSTVFEATANW